MSKVIDIVTGKRYMTNQNAVRHFLKLARKANKTATKRKVYAAALDTMYGKRVYCCNACSAEDFGMCGLRYSKMTDDEKFEKFCFPAFVGQLEKAEIKQYKNLKKTDKNKQNADDKVKKYSGNINEYYKINGENLVRENRTT